MDPPVLSDPMTRKSGSELSDPSGLDSNHADPKDRNTKAPGPKDSGIINSNPDRVRPQEIRPATLDIGKDTADASGPKPRPEVFDPKHATLQPFDPQDVKPQTLDTYGKLEKAQGSNSKVPRPYDPKADSSGTSHYQSNGPTDSSSNIGDSSIQKAKNPPPHDYNPFPSGPVTKEIPSLKPQDMETPTSATEALDSLSDQTRFKGKDTAISHLQNSPTADPKASDDDKSDSKDTHEKIGIFHALPTNPFSLIEALSPSAKPGDRKHSTPNDAEPDPTSRRPNILGYPQPGPDPSDGGKTLKGDALATQLSDEDLPNKSLTAQADLPSMAASAAGSTLLPQSSPSDPPSAGSDNTEDNASASATVGASISEISGSISSSTSMAFTSRRVSGGGVGDGESSQRQSSDSVRKESSGTTLLASRKKLERSGILTRARELVYRLCIYVLAWLLLSL